MFFKFFFEIVSLFVFSWCELEVFDLFFFFELVVISKWVLFEVIVVVGLVFFMVFEFVGVFFEFEVGDWCFEMLFCFNVVVIDVISNFLMVIIKEFCNFEDFEKVVVGVVGVVGGGGSIGLSK